MLVIASYLNRTPFGEESHPFFEFGWTEDGVVHWSHSVRVTQLGEFLFLLRREPGFADICRRLDGHNLRAAFFEANSAWTFKRRGFSIYARKETGERGDDFDFEAVHGSLRVNVEVTAFEAPHFSRATVLNALRHKRGQLPADAPAIIVCVFPEAWLADVDVNQEFDSVTTEFLRSTGRVNHVEFVTERRVPLPDGTGGIFDIRRALATNHKSRFPSDLLEDLMVGPQVDPAMEQRVLSSRSLADVPIPESEFFAWVDWAIDGVVLKQT
jgi:hypothetical protein